MDNFIAVGTLKTSSQEGREDAVPQNLDCPGAEISKLEMSGWIRTVVHGEVVQVYVLPEDVGQTIIPRPSGSSLRRALKVVMSKLEEHKEEAPIEDESLFYIFNTLKSPKPNVEALSDPWAKAAMEDILNQHTKGLLGLKTSLYPYQRRSAAFMIQKESEPGESLDPRLQTFQGPTGQTYYYDKEEGTVTRDKRLYSGPCGGNTSSLF